MRNRRSAGLRAAGPAVRPRRGAFAALCALAACAAGPALAASPGLEVSGQWFRLIIPSSPAAGYFTLSNRGDAPQRLVGADSPGCAMLMLHRSVSRNGEDSMAMVSSVAVPAHGKVAFAPGGYHLMCMSPTPLMKPGESVPVTLKLADGTTVSASFPVRGATGR